jgi:cytochrome c oxidase subunit 4
VVVVSTEHSVVSTEHPTVEVEAYDGHVDATGHKHGMTNKGYVGVAAILAIMTACEVTLTYLDIPGGLFLTFLLLLMAFKFITVVSRFMHLKFDNRIFSWLFYSGLILAICVYAAALATFQFFSRS